MKRVFIVHRWEGSPDEPMHKWLKKELKEKGFEVEVPEMPNPDEPEINAWINKLKKVVREPDEDTYFIGHSIGCQGILRYLETLGLGIKVGGAIFIAPWMELDEQTIKEEGEEVIEIAKPWTETSIDWDKVKSHSDNFVCIFSDDDAYVPLSNQKLFEEKLSSKIIMEHGKGHYSPDDNIEDNPAALAELLNISNQ
ncbi:MAG: alpha/beta hydrolase, partial [Nanoarchaeota archaeon]|nr:alpha/beta hydrolase [Nanoarchaeota archaeon]